jgi:hypothetical protein
MDLLKYWRQPANLSLCSQLLLTFLTTFMLPAKFNRIVGFSVLAVLVCGPVTKALSADTSTNVQSAYQIFQKVQKNYASLSSYSDEGRIVTTADDTTVTAAGFTIRAARPGFYHVEWSQYGGPSYPGENTGIQAVWSAGAGDFIQMGWGVQRQYDRDIAFAKAVAASDSAALAIPQMFFNTQWQDQRDDSILDERRLADKKVGDVDCYVLARDLQNGETKTFWIGKQDFLIREIRTEISGKDMQKAWEETANRRPSVLANFHDFSSIETHTNMVVNGTFLHEDFIPAIPMYQKSDYR